MDMDEGKGEGEGEIGVDYTGLRGTTAGGGGGGEDEDESLSGGEEGHGHGHGYGHGHSHGHGEGRGRSSGESRTRPWWPVTIRQNSEDSVRLLMSHLLTRSGDKMWEFVIPLILSSITPLSLLPAALFGFMTTLARVVLGFSIGTLVDKRDRLTVVMWGTLLQAVSVGISGFTLYLLLEESIKESAKMQYNIFATWISSCLMVVLLLSAVLGSLAALAMDLSVERDWVPTIVVEDFQLTTMNARMRQIDLLTEVGGPFIAGIFLLLGNIPAVIIVASFNFVTFYPQFQLLKAVYNANPELAQKPLAQKNDQIAENDDGVGFIQGAPQRSKLIEFLLGEWNPLAAIYLNGTLFWKQPTRLLIISYALLWLTNLSPHDPVLTAYLRDTNYTDMELGMFRGVGAIVGVMAVFAFPFVVDRAGLKSASLMFISEEGVCLIIAGLLFQFSSKTDSLTGKFFFMLFIVLSRCGLYGFEVGEIQILQQTIPEDIRGRVGSVETALTSMATLVFYALGMIFSTPSQFTILVWSSVFFINLGVVTFIIWSLNWDIHSEEHVHPHGAHDESLHVHSSAQEQQLMLSGGVHTHLHLHKRKRVCLSTDSHTRE